MSRLSPNVTFAVLLFAALALLAVGLSVGRREQTVRVERDREPAKRFSDNLQQELHRLERLYETRLMRICRTVPLDDKQAIWKACDQLTGVRQFSLIHNASDAAFDWHLPIDPAGEGRWPEPTLKAEGMGPQRSRVVLSEAELRDENDDAGWIDEPGKPLLFWLRRPVDTYVVLLVDRAAVTAAFDRWINTWAAESFAPVLATGGPDRLLAPGDRPLLSAGPPRSERPDFLLPMRTRFGTWQIASWDRQERRITYEPPVLVGSATLAVLLATLSVVLSMQQRRTQRHAEERVSFVNAVSHELRVPLTNILLNIDLAAEATDDARAHANRLGLVQEEARRLGRLIDNVLTFSRHEQGKLRAEARACVPASVLAAVVEQFAPSFQRRALEVRCTGEISAPCLLDADALAQILANLLSNVEKYVPGGVVEIAGAMTDGTLTITVTDQGPGIPAEASERIFRPFERLDSRVNEGASGTGLGLAIARDLATTMGGTLRLRPSTRGACFELRVPAPPASPLKSISAA